MKNEQVIMTVDEFRKLSGVAPNALSDAQVIDAINSLDFFAKLHIKQIKAQQKDEQTQPN